MLDKVHVAVTSLVLAITVIPSAHAIELLRVDDPLVGGDLGYGVSPLFATDDGSSGALNLPFEIRWFDRSYSTFFLNNNGNITFESPLGDFTPEPFPVANQPMLAPYWADVDTGSGPLPGGGNQVWVMSPNENTLVVTWDRVGYFSENTSKVNTFQLALYKTDSNGSFDAEFRYQQLQWTTGDASDGFAGLGGVRAQAGWDAGDGRNWQVLDGSLTDDVLNLVNTTNVLGGEKGLFRFSFNAGQLPGSTASNPILPVFDPDEVEAGWDFTFNVTAVDQMIFIDPDVATGYTYTIETPDQFFTSVLLPEGLGDGLYTIEVWDGTQYVTEVLNAEGGTVYSFGSAVTLFRVTGIEPEANLDPTDPYAFVTGLTFASTGTTSMSQIPIITSITAPVPEPETLALVVAGLFVVWRCQGRHSHCLVP